MKILRDDPIEEGIDAFFEEKQKLEEEKQKLEEEIRDYEQKYLDQYYDQLHEQELLERLDLLDDQSERLEMEHGMDGQNG